MQEMGRQDRQDRRTRTTRVRVTAKEGVSRKCGTRDKAAPLALGETLMQQLQCCGSGSSSGQ